MPRADSPFDVLVLGGHPAAYLAAAVLTHKSGLNVLHSTLPSERFPARLVLINPAFFELHKILPPFQKQMENQPLYGMRFLADDSETSSEYRSKTPLGFVSVYAQVQDAMKTLAQNEGAELRTPSTVQIRSADETGVDVALDDQVIRTSAVILAGELAPDEQQILNMPPPWERDVLHRHTFYQLGSERLELGSRPTLPMSLDLKGSLTWAWMLPMKDQVQFSISQPIDQVHEFRPRDMMRHWLQVLHDHAVLERLPEIEPADLQHIEMPLAGALSREGVANRTLLVGPAGGFYSACSEDIYPNCWSAIHAANILRKALKEPHLQDALNAYRSCWRTTLGDYLRGPQQNLRFLLPLVYRNQQMTARLSESILLGKSVVR